MLILKIKLTHLRNGEHDQFHIEFDKMVTEETPTVLGVEAQYAIYKPLLNDEFVALNFISKNFLSDELEGVNQPRVKTYRGFVNTVKGAINHIDPEKKKAAAKIMVVIKSFGNIAALSYDEITVKIRKMNTELTTNYADEVAMLNVGEWLSGVIAQNDAFDSLMGERYATDAGKTPLRMKMIRKEVDAAYRKIIVRIEALMEVNGDEIYKGFVSKLNTLIDKYNKIIVMREGHNGNDDNNKTPKPE